MTDMPPEMPEVGAEIRMDIFPSPTRTTLFPEQCVIAGGGTWVEIIFMRNDVVLNTQTAKVKAVTDGLMELEVHAAGMAMQLTDLGHVRLAIKPSVELAVNLLKHAAANNGLDLVPVIAQLTNLADAPK